VVAFKISANEDCIAVEKFIITALHHHELYISGRRSFNIPHFVELEAFGIPDNAVDPTCCSVFDQIYDSIEPFTIDHVLAVWNILTVAHDAGFAHGDIRLPNCMWSTKDSCVVLIDWSSGRVLHSDPKPSPPGLKFQCPSFVTASVPILTAIDEKKAVEIYRADEAVSMIWLALHAKFPLNDVHKARGNPSDAIEARKMFWKYSIDMKEDRIDIESEKESVKVVKEIIQWLETNRASPTITVQQIDNLVADAVTQIFSWNI